MNRLINLARRFRILAHSGLCWLAAGAAALAQAPGQEKPAEAPPYVVPYALVILCIGLGVTIVINSARRRDRAKPEVFGEPK
jgi:hypothetical protein